MTGPKNSLFADLRFFPYNKNRKRNGEWIMTQSSDEIIQLLYKVISDKDKTIDELQKTIEQLNEKSNPPAMLGRIE